MSIQRYVQGIADRAYHYIWDYTLDAHPTNLAWALRQNDDKILNYEFKSFCKTYSILEFAVKCEDLEGTRKIVELKKTLNHSILHFYIDCLNEGNEPNLELLTLLIDNVSDIQEQSGEFLTLLGHALMHMKGYERMHWDVIELLLEKGATIANEKFSFNAPFEILKRSPKRSVDENAFLDRLVTYVILERKYHPDSKSYLNLSEFKFHTLNFRTRFNGLEASFSASSSYSYSVKNLLHNIDQGTPEQRAEIESIADCVRYNLSEQRHANLAELSRAIQAYHTYFTILVKDASFNDCFYDWQLTTTISELKKSEEPEHRAALSLLVPQESKDETRG